MASGQAVTDENTIETLKLGPSLLNVITNKLEKLEYLSITRLMYVGRIIRKGKLNPNP